MTKKLAALAVAVLIPFTFASPAEATRPSADAPRPDLCKNRGAHAMPGSQTIVGFGRLWTYVDPAQAPNRAGRRACTGIAR